MLEDDNSPTTTSQSTPSPARRTTSVAIYEPQTGRDLSSEADLLTECDDDHYQSCFGLADNSTWYFYFDAANEELYFWSHRPVVVAQNELHSRQHERVVHVSPTTIQRNKEINRKSDKFRFSTDSNPFSTKLRSGAEDLLMDERKLS